MEFCKPLSGIPSIISMLQRTRKIFQRRFPDLVQQDKRVQNKCEQYHPSPHDFLKSGRLVVKQQIITTTL